MGRWYEPIPSKRRASPTDSKTSSVRQPLSVIAMATMHVATILPDRDGSLMFGGLSGWLDSRSSSSGRIRPSRSSTVRRSSEIQARIGSKKRGASRFRVGARTALIESMGADGMIERPASDFRPLVSGRTRLRGLRRDRAEGPTVGRNDSLGRLVGPHHGMARAIAQRARHDETSRRDPTRSSEAPRTFGIRLHDDVFGRPSPAVILAPMDRRRRLDSLLKAAAKTMTFPLVSSTTTAPSSRERPTP